MPLIPVKYEGEIKDTVDAYNSLDKDTQSGKYWDGEDTEIKKVKKHIKDHYVVAQDYTCVYCKHKSPSNHGRRWDIEHIIPKSPYPQFLFTEKNLAISCKDCNGVKSDKNVLVNPKRKTFPKKSEDYIIVHPHFDEYDEHIGCLADSKIYVENTPKGIDTILICGLHRFLPKYAENLSLDNSKRAQEFANVMNEAKTKEETFFIMALMKKDLDKAMNDMLDP